MTKTCSLCRETKPLDQFDKDRSISSGYRGRCKACRRSIDADYRQAKRSGQDTKVATIEAARKRHVSHDDKQKRLISEANRNAIQRLIRIHEDEFRMLVKDERIRVGVAPKWVSLTQVAN